uniref:Uncharacterized protein n=1 Tax=Cyprinus carpio TaxID=7962 RepID=A0A8C2GMA2_CYPCA
MYSLSNTSNLTEPSSSFFFFCYLHVQYDYSFTLCLSLPYTMINPQLIEVYSSSPALERYFYNVTINNLQDTTAQFKLQFMMPLDHEQLIHYTLSLKMVKNVLFQHLYDRDTGESFYIIPTSLHMEGEDIFII